MFFSFLLCYFNERVPEDDVNPLITAAA